MEKYIILKLDTPCTLTNSAMRVPQAEPINFAKALCYANEENMLSTEVVLLGTSQDQIEVGERGTVRILPYFGEPRTIKNEFDEHTKIILWQGRHCFNVRTPSGPNDLLAQLALTNPYSAGDFERLQTYKIWQIMMYNLISSSICEDCQKFFLITDLRLPLMELNKIDPVAVPKPLPKGIIMLTQAYHAEQYMKWANKFGNASYYPEIDLTDYMYKFENAMYLPLHALPIMSHRQFFSKLTDKPGVSIFQVQSIRYIDDYRKKKLRQALKIVYGYCTLHGRFRAEERGMVVSTFPEYADNLLEHVIDNSQNAAECFFDSARILSTYQASLVVTDQRYARFGLCPNRVVEALATGTMPLIEDDEVLQWCDDTLKASIAALEIDAHNTKIVDAETNVIGRKKRVVFCDKTGKELDYDTLTVGAKAIIDKLEQQLRYALYKFGQQYFK